MFFFMFMDLNNKSFQTHVLVEMEIKQVSINTDSLLWQCKGDLLTKANSSTLHYHIWWKQ